MSDDIVLDHLLVEGLVECTLGGAILQSVRDSAQQLEGLLGKVFDQFSIEASSDASVVKRAKPGFLFKELVAVA